MADSALHDLAVLCFGRAVSQLNKLEASTLIKELMESFGGTSRKISSPGTMPDTRQELCLEYGEHLLVSSYLSSSMEGGK